MKPMNLLQKLLAGVGLSALALAPLSGAIGQPVSFTSAHKWTDTATSKTYVYIPGQTAGWAVAGFTAPNTVQLRLKPR